MSEFVMNTEGKYGGQIVQELTSMFTQPSKFNDIYKQWGDRLLYMDSSVVPGAFQMNTTWYVNAPDFYPLPFHDEHVHDFDELVGFIGSNPADKYDLGVFIPATLFSGHEILTVSVIIRLFMGIMMVLITKSVFWTAIAVRFGIRLSMNGCR